MKRTVFAIISTVLTAQLAPLPLAFVGVTSALAAPETEDDLISRGVKLRRTGDDQGARDLFSQAYERFHSPRAAGQLGLAAQALGRWEEAEAMLKEALRSPGDPWVKKNFDALTGDIQIVKGHIARIEILGNPEGAEIVVNGRKVGRIPLAGPVTTSAGEVDVEARAPGYLPEVRKLNLVGGQYQQLVIRLQKDEPATRAATTAGVGAAAAIEPSTASTGEAASDNAGARPGAGISEKSDMSGSGGASPLRVGAKWGALGLSGAGLAVGVVSTIVRAGKLDDFKNFPGGGCLEMNGRAVDPNGLAVPGCQSLLDSYKSMRTWQIVGFVSAGVFAATWLALLLTEPTASSGRNVARAPRFVCGPTNDLSGASCLLSL